MRDLSPSRLLGVTAVLVTAWWILVFSPIGDYLESQIAQPVEYGTRAALMTEPPFHKRLKILAFDDPSAAEVKSPVMSVQDWIRLATLLAERRPSLVMISGAYGLSPRDVARFPTLKAALAKLPLAGGAHFSENRLPGRAELKIERPENDLRKLSAPRGVLGAPAPDWLPVRAGFLYGPDADLLSVFRQVGHLRRSGWHIEPYLRVDKRWAVPYEPLLAAKKVKLDDDSIWIDGSRVRLDRQNRLVPNLLSPVAFYHRSRSMGPLLTGSLKSSRVAASFVEPGDVVLILPQDYLGSADVVDTPAGPVSEGLIQASVLNGVLTRRWITPVTGYGYWVAGALILGFLHGFLLRRFLYLLVFALTGTGAIILGVFAFVQVGVMTPWFSSGLAFGAASFLTFAMRVVERNRRQIIAAASLKQHLPPERIPAFLKQLGAQGSDASTEVVTVMFIDVVGFSLTAEDQKPSEVFQYLKEFSADMRRVIYKHEGVVNKSLGDGLLAIFGLGEERRSSSSDDALKCAIELQEMCYARCIAASNAGRPLYPLRIGLNTAPVHVGNLGDGEFIDLTVIGHGVNLASRFESAADYFKIMMGSTVRELLRSFDRKAPEFRKRLVTIKHHSDLVEAFEYDPFASRPDAIMRLLDVYWRSIGISRAVPRDEVALARLVSIDSTVGKGVLRNYSRGGLGLELECFLARGVMVTLEMKDQALRRRLDEKAMGTLMLEIRWGKPSATGAGYLHGGSFVGLNAEQKDFLFRAIRETVGDGVFVAA